MEKVRKEGDREGRKHELMVQFSERLGQAGRAHRAKAAVGMVVESCVGQEQPGCSASSEPSLAGSSEFHVF